MSVTLQDIQKALWSGYVMLDSEEDGVCGKSCEAEVCVIYPNWWECETEDQFLVPKCVTIYAYCLGPSRLHKFFRGDVDKQIDSNTWESPDPFEKALTVVNEWIQEWREEN